MNVSVTKDTLDIPANIKTVLKIAKMEDNVTTISDNANA